MSWGNRILVVFIAFGSMISYMVYRCVRTPVNLVSEQYYKDELAYQQVIDDTRQANALPGRLELVQNGDLIRLQIPGVVKGMPVRGSIFFYCPADMERDKTISLSTDETGRQQVPAATLRRGHYTVKVSWATGGKQYFTEQPLTIK